MTQPPRLEVPPDVARATVKLAAELLAEIAEDAMLRGSQRAAARRGLRVLEEALTPPSRPVQAPQ